MVSHIAPGFNYFKLANVMVLLKILLASQIVTLLQMVSHDQKYHFTPDFNCLPIFVPVSSYDQKCHVVNHFDCVDLMNAIVSFTVLSESYYSSANDVT